MKSVAIFSAASAVLSAFSLHASEDPRPNIVFILADDLGWTDLGCMGSDYYETPNIDRLASESLVFSQAYSSAPNSAPSRACLMTGMFTPRHGVFTVSSSERGDRSRRKLIPVPNTEDVRSDFVTMAEMLSSAGYVCGHVGKWHLGDDKDGTGPLSQGFMSNVAGGRAGAPYSYFYPYGNRKGQCHKGLEDGTPGEYLTDRLTTEGIKFISSHKNSGKPFFLYLAHHAVHTPLRAPEELVARYEKKPAGSIHSNPVYAAMIESLDKNVGRVCSALDSLGLTENTILIFYSDNGGSEPITDNYPLRGGKGMAYEGGTRVPLIIRWPGHISESHTDVPVYGIDFYPTLANIAGVSPSYDLDGDDIFELVGTDRKDRDMYWHFPAYLQAYKGGENRFFRTTPYSSIRSGDWKLIYFYEDGDKQLFNLKEDISEKDDLSDVFPDVTDQLYRKLEAWLEKTDAPLPVEKNPYYMNEK